MARKLQPHEERAFFEASPAAFLLLESQTEVMREDRRPRIVVRSRPDELSLEQSHDALNLDGSWSDEWGW